MLALQPSLPSLKASASAFWQPLVLVVLLLAELVELVLLVVVVLLAELVEQLVELELLWVLLVHLLLPFLVVASLGLGVGQVLLAPLHLQAQPALPF